MSLQERKKIIKERLYNVPETIIESFITKSAEINNISYTNEKYVDLLIYTVEQLQKSAVALLKRSDKGVRSILRNKLISIIMEHYKEKFPNLEKPDFSNDDYFGIIAKIIYTAVKERKIEMPTSLRDERSVKQYVSYVAGQLLYEALFEFFAINATIRVA